MQEVHFSPWSRGGRLGPEARASLVELNLRFLELAGSRDPGAPAVPLEFAALVAALSPAQRAAAARCPYALFDLRFSDEVFWRTRLADAAAWHIADEPDTDPRRFEFVRLAIFYAWHLAATARLSAPLILGMHARTAGAFGAMTVDRLPRVALSEAVHLTPRWHYCTAFWQSLLAAAAQGDEPLLRRIQLYGIQLAAAPQLLYRPR